MSGFTTSGEITMKMIIVIVKDHDADTLTQALTAGDFRVTRIASTSGFLRSGVVTLLLGVEDTQVDAAVQLMRENLGSSSEKKATLFVVPVQRFEQV
jgi:uncharacterized protein YaaQ